MRATIYDEMNEQSKCVVERRIYKMPEISSLTAEEMATCRKISPYLQKTADVRVHPAMREQMIMPGASVATVIRAGKVFKTMAPLDAAERIQHVTQTLVDNGVLTRLTGAEITAHLGERYESRMVYYWLRHLDKLEPKHPAVATPLVQPYAPAETPVASTKRVEVSGKLWDVDMAAHGLPISGGTRLILTENVAASA